MKSERAESTNDADEHRCKTLKPLQLCLSVPGCIQTYRNVNQEHNNVFAINTSEYVCMHVCFARGAWLALKTLACIVHVCVHACVSSWQAKAFVQPFILSYQFTDKHGC